MKDVLKYFEEISDPKSGIDRYGIPFRTVKKKYFYDTGTGKVFELGNNVYDLLIHLFRNKGKYVAEDLDMEEGELEAACMELAEAIDNENIFKSRAMDGFNCAQVNELEEQMGNGSKMLILEVTEKCNLRCKYCIYNEHTENYRSFGFKEMTEETAIKAIDHYFDHAGPEVKPTLSFYGGEPLLNFKVIKAATEYFDKRSKELKAEPSYGITSNLTKMNKEIAEFFHKHKFIVMCSLDGDREIQDENRPMADGSSSFDKTMAGLKLLVEEYGDDAGEDISINAVVTRPYSADKYKRMNDFFGGLEFLSDNMHIRTTYAGYDNRSDTTELEPNMDMVDNTIIGNDGDMSDWEFDNCHKEDVVLTEFLEQQLLNIHKRRISDVPFKDSGLNACCIPTVNRLYVTVDGKFGLCERVGNAPYVGDVDNGIDVDRIKKYYVNDYTAKSIENCKNCWAFYLCDVCYARCYDENGLDMHRKQYLCESCRYVTYSSLIKYHMLLEERPEWLEKYNDEKYDWK